MRGHEYDYVLMTRDGFAFLDMGCAAKPVAARAHGMFTSLDGDYLAACPKIESEPALRAKDRWLTYLRRFRLFRPQWQARKVLTSRSPSSKNKREAEPVAIELVIRAVRMEGLLWLLNVLCQSSSYWLCSGIIDNRGQRGLAAPPLPNRRSSPPPNFNEANMPTHPVHKSGNIARRFSSIANYVATAFRETW